MSVLETGIMSAIIKRMPARTKRSVLLASLYAELTDKPNLSELNNSLSLVKDIAALELPAILHRWLWKSSSQVTSALRTEIVSFRSGNVNASEMVVGNTPSCLVYASKQEMVRDIERLIALVKQSRIRM